MGPVRMPFMGLGVRPCANVVQYTVIGARRDTSSTRCLTRCSTSCAICCSPPASRGYVARQRIGEAGLTGRLYAVSTPGLAAKPFLADFVRLMRETSLLNLAAVSLL